MDNEAGLIKAILDKPGLLKAMDEGITESFFEQHAEEYNTVLTHYRKYNTVINVETFKSIFPNFVLPEISEPVEYYIDALKNARRKRLLRDGLTKAIEAIKTDPKRAEEILQKTILTSRKEISLSTDLDVRTHIELRQEDYLAKKNQLGVDGLSTSWDFLDSKTGGYHPGDLVCYIAEPKKGKSWFLVWQAHHIWKHERVPVLFLTREMRPDAIRKRFDSINCKLNYDLLRRGLLPQEDEDKYFKYLKEIEQDEVPFVVLGYSLIDGGATVSSLIPKVERHLMDGGALFVDGIYLMEDDRGENDWKAIINIAKDLKQLGQSYNIPVIATSQATIQGKNYVPNIENIAYGKYLAQYVDALLSISQDPEAKITNTSYIHLIAYREGDTGSFPVEFQFEPYVQFNQKQIHSIDEEEDDTNYTL